MKIGTSAAALAVLILGGWTLAGNDDTNQPPPVMRLELDLVDGSHIIGIPKIETVPLQTAYARMDIPLKQILSVKMDDNHETASLDLVNGDKLKGVIALKPLELTTVFGPVKIGIEHLREIAVVSSASRLPAALARSLILYYPFDGDDGDRVADTSGKGNAGKTLQGAKRIGDGWRGGGCRLTGGRGRIEVPDSPLLNLNVDQDKTLCLRWKKEGNIEHKTLFSKRREPNGNLGLSFMTVPSQGCYYLHVQVDHHAKFSASWRNDEWNHVALVKKGTAYRVYHNGREAPLNNSMGWPLPVDITVNTPLEIGGEHMADFGFEGIIDEVMVFDRALSPEEVETLYKAK